METEHGEPKEWPGPRPRFEKTYVIGFGLILAALLLSGVLGFSTARRVAERHLLVTQSHTLIEELEILLATLVDVETGQRGFLLTEDEKYLQPYHQGLDRLRALLVRLEDVTAEDAERAAGVAALRPTITAKLRELSQTIDLAKSGNRPAALALFRQDTGKVLMDELRSAVAQVQLGERQRLEQRSRESQASYWLQVISILLTATLGIVLVGLVFVSSARHPEQRPLAAQRIAEQAEQFRVTLLSIGDAVMATDAQGRVSFMNPVAERLTGWAETDARGRKLEEVLQIVNEETRRSVENPALRALKEGTIVGLANHTILISRDGTERPIDDSAAPIRDERGGITGAILVFRDVTDQKGVSHRLAESEARKSAILDNALDCIVTCDHLGTILEFNPAAERTFGHRREDVIGQELSEIIIPAALRSRHRNGMERILQTGRSRVTGQRLIMTGLRADGSEFPIEFSVTLIQTGRAPMFTAYLRDISERIEAEKAAAERLRHATLAAEIGIALTGQETLPRMLQACTETMVRNLEAACARIWTMNEPLAILELRASFGMDANREPIQTRIPVGQSEVGRIARDRKPFLTSALLDDPHLQDQQWVREAQLISFAGYPLIVSSRLIGVMAIYSRRPLEATTQLTMASAAREVALGIERKEMEDRLRQLVADLSEADRRKDEFLATLAHELRNPLAPLRNGLEVMRLAGAQARTAEEARTMMERQLTQLVRLVDDLMDVSRITRGKLELRKQRIPLAAVLKSAIETSRPLIEEMGHEFVVRIPQEPILVEGDLVRLAQVFSNLLNNAAKYSERGSRIELSARKQEGDVLVSVEDNGIGIEPAHLPHIFGMFTQVDHSLEKAQGGLGIGLTLVKRLVEMHGGDVQGFSEGLGKGSQFVVQLPVVAEYAPSPVRSAEEQSPQSSGHRVLIVDDNRDGADSLAMMLQALGHVTCTAYDGLSGVEAASQFRPDVLLLDIGLPRLNGYEACHRIRQEPWGRGMVILAVTGWGQEEDVRRSQESGFDHHLVKPVDWQALAKILAGLPSRRQ